MRSDMARPRHAKGDEEYSDDEAAQRALEAARRSFTLPYKPMKALVGTTPRARAMAKRKAAKARPKS
jgi:hypothetical protein